MSVLEPFDFKNISYLVDRVENLWGPAAAEKSFRRTYAEAVIRQDMHDNQMQFQITENGQLKAIACFSTKGETPGSAKWMEEQHKKQTPEQRHAFKLCHDYLTMMDKKAYGFMTQDDVKLDMFISVEQGWGKKILEPALKLMKEKGFKNLYLWTDCECNVEWYAAHGYELLLQEVFEPFSSEDKKYQTYVFKRKLI